MKKELTTRQFGMLIFLSIISLKLIVLPSILARFTGKDGIFALLIWFAIELCILLGIIWVMNTFPDLTFKEILTNCYGKAICKIVFFLLFLYFFLKSVLAIKDLHNYLIETLFDDIEWYYFLMPLLATLGYIVFSRLRGIGRTFEIFFIFIFITVNLTTLISLGGFDFNNLLPILENGVVSILKGAYRVLFCFGDYLFIFFALGKIKMEKSTKKTALGYAFLGIGTVLNFYVVFYGIFGNLAINKALAISDVTLYSTGPTTLGRLDWILIIMWVIALVFESGLLCYCAVASLKEVTQIKNEFWCIILFLLLVFIFDVFTSFSFDWLIKFVFTDVIVVFCYLVQVGVPASLFLATLLKRGKYAKPISKQTEKQ